MNSYEYGVLYSLAMTGTVIGGLAGIASLLAFLGYLVTESVSDSNMMLKSAGILCLVSILLVALSAPALPILWPHLPA